MLELNISGYARLEIKNVVLDFNGTLAQDGFVLPCVPELIEQLVNKHGVEIHIVTADTHGTVRQKLNDAKLLDNERFKLKVIKKQSDCSEEIIKAKYLNEIGGSKSCICIGNGRNDALMLQQSAIGISLIQQEGCSSISAMKSDLLFGSITNALESLIHEKRIIASLRN